MKMESLEHNLYRLESIQKESLDKQKDFLYKSILDVSQNSVKSANNFDYSFKKNFPEINDIGKNESFTPKCVVEFRDGKAFQVLEGRNEVDNLLDNRIIMGTYYIDVGHQINSDSVNCDIMYCIQHNKTVKMKGINYIYSTTNFDCGCPWNSQYIYRFPKNDFLARNESRPDYRILITHTFQVDNYLNLYHQGTGLYLLFNKTAFPKLPFYLAKQYTQLRNEKDIYYKIFFSKRLENLTFQFTLQNYQSVDNRQQFLENINQLIPDDYQEVYDFFNRFRKFDGYGQTLETNAILDVSDDETNYLDSKDRLIQSLREKLKETMSRIEKAEQLAKNMVEEYQSKSIEIQDLHRKLDMSRITIKEIKSQENQKKISEIEKVKQEKFNLYQQLLESEKYHSMFDNLGISLESIKKDNEKLSLEIAKMRDINNGLITTIKTEKDQNQKINEDNNYLLREMNNFEDTKSELKKQIAELKRDLKTYQTENQNLTERLTEIGNNSSNALELALNDRVNELETLSQKHQDEKKEVIKENTILKQRLNKIENTLKNLGL